MFLYVLTEYATPNASVGLDLIMQCKISREIEGCYWLAYQQGAYFMAFQVRKAKSIVQNFVCEREGVQWQC